MIKRSKWLGMILGVALAITAAGCDKSSPDAGSSASASHATQAQVTPVANAAPESRAASSEAVADSASGTVTVKSVTTTTIQQTPPPVAKSDPGDKIRTVAIFVKNRADKALDQKVMALEDMLTGKITDLGFSVISREDAVNAVSAFAGSGANAGDANLPGADLDKIMSNNTSALRLAQNMNADYLFVVSITTYSTRKRAFKGYGVDRVVSEDTLRLSYKLLDRVRGGSLTGGTVKSSEKSQFDPSHKPAEGTVTQDQSVGFAEQYPMIDDLLDDASTQLADGLKVKLENHEIREVKIVEGQLAKFKVTCDIADWTIPEVTQTKDGQFVVGESAYNVTTSASVSLNGAVLGSTPGPFQAAPGLSKIRISRALCDDWEMTINVVDKLDLHVSLQLSEAGRARLLGTAAFLENMKAGAKLTDAQAEVLKGYAQTLRQSGFKVDIKGGTEGMVNVKNSIW